MSTTTKITYSNSIILGKNDSGKTYKAQGYQHILLLAPHGSGKGVAFVLPTLLTLEESCIVHDIKLENYQLTSGHRESIGHKIFIFNPLSINRKTHRYNPIDFIGESVEQKINNIQKIANLLINGSNNSKTLFTGLVLYLSATDGIKTLGQISRMINSDLENELTDGIKKINKSNNSHCFDIISGFLDQSQEQREKIINELKESLYLWTNPLVDYATSESDFDIASLKTSKTTIYVGLNPDEINYLQPLMRLFYNHAFERLMDTSMILGNSSENGGVTLILDDFCTLGKLESYAFGYLRGYKVRLFAIASSIQDIEKLYGESDASNIISDCSFKIFFGASDFKTAKHISYLCLDKKENKETMSWQEIMNLSQGLQIILMEKEQPLVLKKMKYYEDEVLKKRIFVFDK